MERATALRRSSTRTTDFLDFLRRELAPTPERWSATLRLTLACVAATIPVMVFRLHLPLLVMILMYLITKEDTTATLVGTIAGILGVTHWARTRPARLPRGAGCDLVACLPRPRLRGGWVIPQPDPRAAIFGNGHRSTRRDGDDRAGRPPAGRAGPLPLLALVERGAGAGHQSGRATVAQPEGRAGPTRGGAEHAAARGGRRDRADTGRP